MGTLPGRCTNEMFCTLGASGRIVQVPDDAAFVCPMCGKTLVSAAAPRRNRLRGATLFSLGVCLAASAAFLGGMVIASIGLWPQPPTTTVLAARPLLVLDAQRHYATLLSPKPLTVAADGRRRATRATAGTARQAH